MASKSAQPSNESVSVRMYRGILGDCFLLTHAIGQKRFNALIDCGALQRIGKAEDKPNTDASLTRLGLAIDNLLADTGNKLDLVIATHEHYDHLSGFMKYHDKFASLKIDQVWLAWTENDADEVAVAIREKRWEAVRALTALVGADDESANLKAFGIDVGGSDETNKDNPARSQVDAIRNVLQFQGSLPDPVDAPGAGKAKTALQRVQFDGKRPVSCAAAFNWLKSKVPEGKVSYLKPGQQVRFGLDQRLMAHVLGPPRNLDRLKQMDPSKEPGKKEVYLTGQDDYDALIATLRHRLAAAGGDRALAADALGDDVEIFTPVDTAQPFDKRFARWPIEEKITEKDKDKLRAIEDEGKYDLPDTVSNRYYDADESSRRIDGDWLGVAESLGLKVDDDVNNTSLALAIEGPGRHVLLFPADAQVGNWLSWHDQDYPSEPGVKSGKGESAKDILARTVLYKVGHHGSHNATAKDMGLEMMTSPHLVAMIPVVEDVAKEQKTRSNPDGWAMPYGDLYTRLKTKTADRIVAGDGEIAIEDAAFKRSMFDVGYCQDHYDAAKYQADPTGNAAWGPKWVSLTLKAKG